MIMKNVPASQLQAGGVSQSLDKADVAEISPCLLAKLLFVLFRTFLF
jgi:hypothetical protein